MKKKSKVDTIEKLAILMKSGFESVDARFDAMDARFDAMDVRFDALEQEMETGFKQLNTKLDRIDTRIAALELAVFGATSSSGGRLLHDSLFFRIGKLEKAVFRK